MNSRTDKKAIRLLALDVDGVLTDGSLIYGQDGLEVKAFNALDGLGITAARQQGLAIAIITGRESSLVQRRAQELSIDYLYMGCRNKTEALQRTCHLMGIDLLEVAYMGDDLNDLGPMSRVGLALAPCNACDDVQKVAHYTTRRMGGRGAVREAVEYILKEEGRWQAVIDSYREERYEGGQ